MREYECVKYLPRSKLRENKGASFSSLSSIPQDSEASSRITSVVQITLPLPPRPAQSCHPRDSSDSSLEFTHLKSSHEPGLAPASAVSRQWDTFSSARNRK